MKSEKYTGRRRGKPLATPSPDIREESPLSRPGDISVQSGPRLLAAATRALLAGPHLWG